MAPPCPPQKIVSVHYVTWATQIGRSLTPRRKTFLGKMGKLASIVYPGGHRRRKDRVRVTAML